ncbi:MAG: hypothetical protein O3B42_05690 [Actinomycetota bacterium]|nr:hypothetical protein [Actinomycetota bacterium]
MLRTSARRGTLSIVMWVFGLSTTMLLVGLWGRAVTVDEQTVTESAMAVVDADLAQDRIYEWIEGAITQSQSIGSADAEASIAQLRQRPEFERAIDNAITGFVSALFAPPGEPAVVDLEAALAPAVPVVVDQLSSQDVSVDEAALRAALGDVSGVQVDTGGAADLAEAVDGARTFLSQVVVFAFFAMMASAAAALALSDERYAMLRTLSIRVLLSSLSFAVLFRLGAWALDPDGGRSPIASGGSVLLGSNGHVFLFIAFVAAVVGSAGAWVAWQRRRWPATAVTSDAMDTDLADINFSDDDTKELLPV